MDTTSLLIGGVAVIAAASAPATLAERGPVTLGGAPARVELGALAGAAGRRVMLVISELSVRVAPGVLYAVCVNGRQVGYVNFLNAANGGPASFTFDVTADVARARGPLTITLSPKGAAAANAQASVGRIALLAY
jgi:hypothetical protein